MKTTVDWLTFRTRSSHYAILENLRAAVGTAADLLTLQTGLKGKDGWLAGAEIRLPDIVLGRIDYGGESQRGWVRVNLTGGGCEWITAYDGWAHIERLPEFLADVEITRLDLALTTYKGEVTHDRVIQAHRDVKFSSGGRQPHYKVIGGSDPMAGRTIYVGQRKGSDKMARCYEKGFELLSKVPLSHRHTCKTLEAPDGTQFDPKLAYRVEVEFKNATKFIPFFAVNSKRDETFAGAYPFCAELLPECGHYRCLTLPDFAPKLELETKLDHCWRAYGPILKAGLLAYGGDREKLLNRVLAEEPSKALIDAGILTVDHV